MAAVAEIVSKTVCAPAESFCFAFVSKLQSQCVQIYTQWYNARAAKRNTLTNNLEKSDDKDDDGSGDKMESLAMHNQNNYINIRESVVKSERIV